MLDTRGNAAKLADIVRDPTDVPPSVGNRTPALVQNRAYGKRDGWDARPIRGNHLSLLDF